MQGNCILDRERNPQARPSIFLSGTPRPVGGERYESEKDRSLEAALCQFIDTNNCKETKSSWK
jgi:hypothetical protein